MQNNGYRETSKGKKENKEDETARGSAGGNVITPREESEPPEITFSEEEKTKIWLGKKHDKLGNTRKKTEERRGGR